MRQPFNNYTANLSWTSFPDNGNWALALFGNYLIGKEALPNTWNVGLSANYLIDNRQPCGINSGRYHRSRDLKNEVPAPASRDNLVGWTADPAVYMPQVLAVPDQRATAINPCSTLSPIVLLSPLPSFIDDFGDFNQHVFNSPTHFSGSNVTYSRTIIFTADSTCSCNLNIPD